MIAGLLILIKTVALAREHQQYFPKWIIHAIVRLAESLQPTRFICIADSLLLQLIWMVRFVSYLELKRVLVNVHSEDDVHHKLLQYAENCLLHVDLRGAVLAHPDLIKPFLLGLDRVVFEEFEHDDQFVFEEGMSDALSLLAPLLISGCENERLTCKA